MRSLLLLVLGAALLAMPGAAADVALSVPSDEAVDLARAALGVQSATGGNLESLVVVAGAQALDGADEVVAAATAPSPGVVVPTTRAGIVIDAAAGAAVAQIGIAQGAAVGAIGTVGTVAGAKVAEAMDASEEADVLGGAALAAGGVVADAALDAACTSDLASAPACGPGSVGGTAVTTAEALAADADAFTRAADFDRTVGAAHGLVGGLVRL